MSVKNECCATVVSRMHAIYLWGDLSRLFDSSEPVSGDGDPLPTLLSRLFPCKRTVVSR